MNPLQCPENTCFFTGHRTISESKIREIALRTREQIYLHIAGGYQYFVCGGAVGFDTIAAMQVARVRAGGEEIFLILALPCRDQTAMWKSTEMLRLYQRIKGMADRIIYVNDLFFEGCMKERNQFMVDCSSACIAYFNDRKTGGTAQTIHMAKKRNIAITNIYSGISVNGRRAEQVCDTAKASPGISNTDKKIQGDKNENIS